MLFWNLFYFGFYFILNLGFMPESNAGTDALLQGEFSLRCYWKLGAAADQGRQRQGQSPGAHKPTSLSVRSIHPYRSSPANQWI